jgi:mannose-6-phosphate isomerase-like protein (cupin superfamily)
MSREAGGGRREVGSNRVVTPGFERRDSRGTFREIVNGFEARNLLSGEMEEGAVLGNHYHRETRVFFYLTRGSAKVSVVNVVTGETEAFDLAANQGCFFEVNESHAVRFMEPGEFVMLKSLAYDPTNPDTYPHPVE